jgi:hypothetical protein
MKATLITEEQGRAAFTDTLIAWHLDKGDPSAPHKKLMSLFARYIIEQGLEKIGVRDKVWTSPVQFTIEDGEGEPRELEGWRSIHIQPGAVHVGRLLLQRHLDEAAVVRETAQAILRPGDLNFLNQDGPLLIPVPQDHRNLWRPPQLDNALRDQYRAHHGITG